MTDRVMKVVLPLFDMSEAASAAPSNEDSVLAGAFVASDGSDFFLYQPTDLARTADQFAAPTQLAALGGRKLRTLTATEAMAADLDPLQLESNRHDPTFNLIDEIAVASVLATPNGRRFAVTFVDPFGSFNRLVPKKWVCNPYGETVIRVKGGQCPNHDDGVLK